MEVHELMHLHVWGIAAVKNIVLESFPSDVAHIRDNVLATYVVCNMECGSGMLHYSWGSGEEE